MLKRTLATLAVAAGLLAAAGPASAATHSISDGTSNTIMFAAAPKGVASDGLGADFILMADSGGQF